MSTSREKLQQARDLIAAKKYDEARAILRTVDHDMALDMIDEIDKIEAAKREGIKYTPPSVLSNIPTETPKRKSTLLRDISIGLLLAFALACAACIGVIWLAQNTPSPIAAIPTTKPPTLTPGKGTVLPTDTAVPPTETVAPTKTIPPTKTSMPTGTTAPTASLTKTDQLKTLVAKISGKKVSEIEVDSLASDLTTFKYPLNYLSVDFAKLDARVTMREIACALKTFQVKSAKYIVYGTIPVQDSFGNKSIGNGVIMTLTPARLSKFNCNDPDQINIENAADSYTIMPALR